MAFPSGWTRRCAITISAVDEPLANFPLHLDASCFPAETLDSSSANKAKADGADLRFSPDAAGTTELPFEVRRWVQDATAGNRRAEVHVKVPALARASTTTIYVWYNNGAALMPAPTDLNGSQAAWDSSYVGVWHFDSTTLINASNAGGVSGTIEGSPSDTVDSPVGLALDLDGVDDAVALGTANTNDSLWEIVLKCDSTDDQIIFGKSTGGAYNLSVWVSSGKPTAFTDIDGSLGYDHVYTDSVNASTTNWEYWAVRNRSNSGAASSRALPSVEATHQAHASDGTYLYSIGGHPNNSAAPLTANNRYDPTSNTWATRAALPAARWGIASCYLSGKIYCVAGYTGSADSARTDIYDIAGDSWSTGTDCPSSIAGQGGKACTDGTYIYVIRGTSVERYDPIGNSWTARANVVGLPGVWPSLICSGGYIYVIGGATPSGYVFRYTIASDTWDGTVYDSAPYAAWAHVCEPVGDGTWMFGFGRGGIEQHVALYRYNPATKVWTQKASYDIPTNAVASAVLGGKLYAYGAWAIGKQEQYSFGHHARYDISSDAWDTSPALIDFHRDGVWVGGETGVTAPLYAGGGNVYVGRQDGYGALYSGAKVAEFRRSNSARSRSWIKASRATLMAPSTFATAGTAEGVAVIISAAGAIVSGETFGTATVTATAAVVPSGIASVEAFGSPIVTRRQAVAVAPSGIASGDALGAHTVAAGRVISGAGAIASGEAFGGHAFARNGSAQIIVGAIASAEAFGAPAFGRNGSAQIIVSGIASAAVVGTAAVSRTGSAAVVVIRRRRRGRAVRVIEAKLIELTGAEPITLAEAKTHLRVDGTDEDALISALIYAAREHCEQFLGLSLSERTLEVALDEFPGDGIELPYGPVREIVSVFADDAEVDASGYLLDDYSTVAKLLPAETWPMTAGFVNAVIVQYIAGYGSPELPLPQPIRTAMLLTLEHWFRNRGAVTERAMAEVPLGVEASLRPYRVRLGMA